MIRAVIFDFNGVIVDDEPVHFALFRDILGELGIELDEKRYHAEYLGYDDRGCFEAALHEAGIDPTPPVVAALIARKAALYTLEAATGLRYFPGAAEAIASLASRWPTAICSGALRNEIRFALGRLGLLDRIQVLVSAEDTSRCKPDPEGYLLTLEALRGLPGLADLEAGQCLVIEDSLAGVTAANAAKMLPVGVSHTYGPAELKAAGAITVLGHLSRLDAEWVKSSFPEPGELASESTMSATNPPEDSEPRVGLLLSRDLIFTSKVTGTASALGHKVMVVGHSALARDLLEKSRPAVVFVDLTAGDLVAPASLMTLRQAAAGVPFVAFGSHVDVQSLEDARLAGCDPVMPRSRFTNELPELIRRYFA